MNYKYTLEEYIAFMQSEKTEKTWLETYYSLIKQGKIIVGIEMRQQIEMLIEDLDNPRYYYDTREADIRIMFIESCALQSKAPFYNLPVILLLWQKVLIEVMYSYKMTDTKLDRFQDILVMVSRKNGKSTMLAANVLYDLFLGEGGQDIVIGSFDEKTAKLIFDEVTKMCNKLDRKEKIVHPTIVTIVNKKNNSVLFRLSSKSKGLDGRNCSTFIMDESHLDPNDNLAMAAKQSMSVRDNPKFINITTNGFVDGYLDQKLAKSRAILNGEAEDERQLSFLFTQDSENEIWRDEFSWFKSSPSLGVVKKMDFLRNNVNDAKTTKSIKAHVLTKDFNIKQNTAEAFLMESDYSYEYEPIKLEDFKNSYCFGAVDLSFSTDLSCAKILLQKPNDAKKYIFTKYFIPEAKLDNSDDKAAGAKYREWALKGYVDVHEGNEVNLSKIAEWFYSLYNDYGIKVYKLGYDLKFAKDFLSTMDIYGYGSKKDETCEMINQSKFVMSTPIKAVEADLKSQLIIGINDMDKWCFSNAGYVVDNEGRIMLVKISQPARIDGIVCQSILQAIYSRYRNDYVSYVNGN